MELMSRAGHDCMNFKDVCPTAMIFVPSEGGVSHRKEEFTSRGGLRPQGRGAAGASASRRQAFQIRLTDKGDCYGKIRRIF